MIKEEIKKIQGYKAFNKGLTNIWEKKFEVGKKYKVTDQYKDYSYHFSDYLEDIFVFYKDKDIEVCEVIGSGDIIENYNSYYDVTIIASSEIEIIKVMSREEIINYFLSMTGYYSKRIENFLIRFHLTNEEIKLFIDKFKNNEQIMDTIRYYYLSDKEVYERKYRSLKQTK